MIRRIAMCLACAIVCYAHAAFGAKVRFISEASEPFNRRVDAELESVGFEVETNAAAEAPLSKDSVAVVHVKREPARVEVWLTEGDRLVLAAIIDRDPTLDEDADSTRIAERLRALLQPLAERARETRPPIPPAPAPTSPAPQPAFPPMRDTAPPRSPEETSEISLDLGGAAVSQPGGAAVALIAGARYEPIEPFGGRLLIAYPITESRIDADGASADIAARFAALALEIHLLERTATLRPALGVGGGVLWITASGDAPLPRQAHTVHEVTGLLFATGTIRYRMSADLSADLGGLVGLAVPRTDIEFSDERVGSVGRPLAMANLSVSYDL